MSSGFKESCLTSSFSCIMTWAFRLATLENFLLHTGHVGSLVVWVDLWRPRLYSTLKDTGHWSHRYGCIQEEVSNSYVISSSWPAHLPLLQKQDQYIKNKKNYWNCTLLLVICYNVQKSMLNIRHWYLNLMSLFTCTRTAFFWGFWAALWKIKHVFPWALLGIKWK